MKFSIFRAEKNLCILYGQVFVMKMFSESEFECSRSWYGCCSDNITAMGDEEGSNCPGKDCMHLFVSVSEIAHSFETFHSHCHFYIILVSKPFNYLFYHFTGHFPLKLMVIFSGSAFVFRLTSHHF